MSEDAHYSEISESAVSKRIREVRAQEDARDAIERANVVIEFDRADTEWLQAIEMEFEQVFGIGMGEYEDSLFL